MCGLRFIAGGAALYAGAVALLLAAGAAQHEATPSVGWFERGVFIVALATLALVAAAMLERPRHTLVARDVLACSLSGMGAAWLVLGIVDQHAFGLYVIAQGSIAWDVIFHGAGEVAIALGVLTMRVPGPVGRRSQTAVALTSR